MLGVLGGASALAALAPVELIAAAGGRQRMGITVASYNVRWKASTSDGSLTQFRNALDFLEHCHRLGGGGIQTGIATWDAELAAKLRAQAEAWEMFVEGQVALPRDAADAERFERQVRTAKEAGVTIIRTVCLGGRRYEDFDTAEAFQQFARRSWESLRLAGRVVRRQRVRLAVENHKDWRVPELLGLLRRLGSEWVGVCVDFGNSLALLEEPMAVIEAYAPFAVTTHFKDMGAVPYGDGFLLSEVPLGEGFLDLRKGIEVLRRARPDIRFNLEMITRDPLKVPCLTRKYWATFGDLPGRHLADTLALVRAHAPPQPLPQTSGRTPDQNLRQEEAHVVRSFAASRERLGFAGTG
jgi:hypothetical protein